MAFMLLLLVGCGHNGERNDSGSGLGPSNLTDLERAIEDQDVAEVQALLAQGVDPNDQSTAPLQVAAHLGSTEIVRLLIDAGAEIDYHEGNNWTALFGAAVDGPTDTVRVLLDNGADPCRRTQHSRPTNYSGMRPVDVATERGNDRVVPLLEEATRACEG